MLSFLLFCLFITKLFASLDKECEAHSSSECGTHSQCAYNDDVERCQQKPFCAMDLKAVLEPISAAMAGFGSVETRQDLEVMAIAFKTSIKDFQAPNIFIGFPSGDFYMIGNCKWSSAGCPTSGSTGLILSVVNFLLMQDKSRHVYNFFVNGTIGAYLDNVGEFILDERDWYTQPTGWGASYISTTDNLPVQSFVLQGESEEDIVTAIDGDEQCYTEDLTMVAVFLGWEACTSESPCADGHGDCETDSDCEGDLVCFQRSSQYNTRSGYDFLNINHNIPVGYTIDICVRPETCASWICPKDHRNRGDDHVCPIHGSCSLVVCCHTNLRFAKVSAGITGMIFLCFCGFAIKVLTKDAMVPKKATILPLAKYFASVADFNLDVWFSIFLLDNGLENWGYLSIILLIFHALIGKFIFDKAMLRLKLQDSDNDIVEIWWLQHQTAVNALLLLEGGSTSFVKLMPGYPLYAPITRKEQSTLRHPTFSLLFEHVPQFLICAYYLFYISIDVEIYPVIQMAKGSLFVFYVLFSVYDTMKTNYEEYKFTMAFQCSSTDAKTNAFLPKVIKYRLRNLLKYTKTAQDKRKNPEMKIMENDIFIHLVHYRLVGDNLIIFAEAVGSKAHIENIKDRIEALQGKDFKGIAGLVHDPTESLSEKSFSVHPTWSSHMYSYTPETFNLQHSNNHLLPVPTKSNLNLKRLTSRELSTLRARIDAEISDRQFVGGSWIRSPTALTSTIHSESCNPNYLPEVSSAPGSQSGLPFFSFNTSRGRLELDNVSAISIQTPRDLPDNISHSLRL